MERSDAELEDETCKEGRIMVMEAMVSGSLENKSVCGGGACVVLPQVGPRIRGRNEPSSVGRLRSRPALG